ncbi:four-carbon acid sugar kinase family protein [Humibacillus xanthopallidus]|uniref:four-carbon acid sugar kinase family protein n=1 Tax=Humibacillus xanthopallidus TaxID=412689 RepID=UPI001FEC9887|nr:four-carbon acid sugar kinase family protein [Humibacillus xanthopallidus]
MRALLRVSRSTILLGLAPEGGTRDADCATRVLTVDTHSRGLEAAAAATRAAAAAAAVSAAPVVVKKIDSLLRGNVAAEIAAVAQQLGRTAVVAVSNPALGRVVRDGVLHVEGTPLHETDLWQVETSPAPTSVQQALRPLRTVLISQHTVDAGTDAVAQAVHDIAASGAVAVCDAATEADLETIHAAAIATSSRALLVGSGAMSDTAVRALTPEHDAAPAGLPRLSSLLMVLGTRASAVAAQLAQLAGKAAHIELIDPARLLADPRALQARLEEVTAHGLVVVALDPAAAVESGDASRLVAALADALAPHVTCYEGVFLTGGETARAALDRLGVTSLSVLAELERGTVVSQTQAGHVVVTRPGSFGAADSLVRTARRLLGTDLAADGTSQTTTRAAANATATAATAASQLAAPATAGTQSTQRKPAQSRLVAPTKENP